MEIKQTNFAIIGLGGRGQGNLGELISIDGVKVVAVCDKYEDRARRGVEIVKEKTGEEPEMYLDYKELLKRDDIKAVMVATTWITHVRIAVDCMRAGKHVAMEVGGAASIEECWQLVRASEETGKFCMLLENCCYDRNEMALLRMMREGIFGEVVHMQGGYEHDLRDEIGLGRENRHGRIHNFKNRNGELYPTHQLGPIAKALHINRGNRFLTLTSMASKACGLNTWLKNTQGEDYDLADYKFNQGDIVTTMIKCAHGETITLVHDCTLPRPYSRNYKIHGTRAAYNEDAKGIYIDGVTKHEESDWMHSWEPFEKYLEKYEHPLWKTYASESEKHGHGGMDYLVFSAFVESAMYDLEPPIDVYDAATWIAITCLSEQSIAMGSMPVPVPDFTNGMWIDRAPARRSRYNAEEICEEFFSDEEKGE